MTFVGKILIVLQIVLSLVFMAFAGAVYTVQTKWKTEYEQLAKLKKDTETDFNSNIAILEKSVSDITADLEKIKTEERDVKASLADAEGRAIESRKELEKEKIRSTGFLQSLAIANAEADQRRGEAIVLRGVNNELHKKLDETVAAVRNLEVDKFAVSRKTDAMLAKHKKILLDYAEIKKAARLQGVKLDPKGFKGVQAPPTNVEGFVLDTRRGTRNEPDFIEISIGSDDDLAKGHVLFCYRSSGKGKYLGKIRIVHITPDRAVGVVIEQAKNGLIKKGDNVSTKL